MRVILSRKGFDSSNGGCASPIFPDNTMLSLPIPEDGSHPYDELYHHDGQSYLEIIKKLKGKASFLDTHAHVDPVLCRPKSEMGLWRGCLGQQGAAAGHLINHNIKDGDLFLFFGWYRQVDESGCYVKDAPDLHVIFGYLEVEEILKEFSDLENYSYLKNHPHIVKNYKKNNAIYIASETLSFAEHLPGAGVFKYSDSLKLTANNQTRRVWELPEFFRNINITYNKKSWKDDGFFHSAGIGQEFIIAENEQVNRWAKELIVQNVCT